MWQPDAISRSTRSEDDGNSCEPGVWIDYWPYFHGVLGLQHTSHAWRQDQSDKSNKDPNNKRISRDMKQWNYSLWLDYSTRIAISTSSHSMYWLVGNTSSRHLLVVRLSCQNHCQPTIIDPFLVLERLIAPNLQACARLAEPSKVIAISPTTRSVASGTVVYPSQSKCRVK